MGLAAGLRRGGAALAAAGLALLVAAGPAAADPPRIVQVAAGNGHTCALDDTGAVWCWGRNDKGQLGDGTTDARYLPARVLLGEQWGAQAIASGPHHVCAILRVLRRVRCWGANHAGQLGDGTTSSHRATPVLVGTNFRSVRAIAVGGSHTCAIGRRDRVLCWGLNIQGQVGDGTTGSPRLQPTAVVGLGEATALATGDGHSCAINAQGRAYCWGWNGRGQLGDGTTEPRWSPVAVRGLGEARTLAAGTDHSCAITSLIRTRCWGGNGRGQLGDSSFDDRLAPVWVQDLAGIKAVVSAFAHSCAITNTDRARCWGANDSGQLGNRGSTDRPLAVLVRGFRDVRSVATGQFHSCAVMPSGGVRCWGANWAGQLGDGTTTSSLVPVDVLFPG